MAERLKSPLTTVANHPINRPIQISGIQLEVMSTPRVTKQDVAIPTLNIEDLIKEQSAIRELVSTQTPTKVRKCLTIIPIYVHSSD